MSKMKKTPSYKHFSFQRFLAIVKKEFIQVKRDRISMMMPFMMPIVMMFLFGYAVSTEVDHVKTALLDMSRTESSRTYIDAFKASNYFDVVIQVNDENEMRKLIDGGEVKAGIVISPDFDQKIMQGEFAPAQILIDGTDPTTARTVLSSGMLISENYSRKLMNAKLSQMGASVGKLPGIALSTRVWFNPEMKSVRFTIPALVGLILQNITLMLTAFALVREKERSTIEQLIVTPIRSAELILGKLVPYVFIGYSGFLFALSICVFWFGITIVGSISLLLTLGFLFVFCSLAMGMLISTFARTQLQAMMAMVFVLLPSILLSGFIFPREAMPGFIRAIGYLIPLTYFLDIVRGITLKGVGIEYLLNNSLMLLGFTVIILFAAVKRFRKSLD
jgi:ABC-2 type transport system permease protein